MTDWVTRLKSGQCDISLKHGVEISTGWRFLLLNIHVPTSLPPDSMALLVFELLLRDPSCITANLNGSSPRKRKAGFSWQEILLQKIEK